MVYITINMSLLEIQNNKYLKNQKTTDLCELCLDNQRNKKYLNEHINVIYEMSIIMVIYVN